jgi:hypothetical protein
MVHIKRKLEADAAEYESERAPYQPELETVWCGWSCTRAFMS